MIPWQIIESENGLDARMVPDCDGEGSSKKPSIGQLKESVDDISAQKKYEEARGESGSCDSQVSSKSSLILSKSGISDENLILKEVDKSSKSRKASGKRSCPPESNREGSYNTDDLKLSTTGISSGMTSKVGIDFKYIKSMYFVNFCRISCKCRKFLRGNVVC